MDKVFDLYESLDYLKQKNSPMHLNTLMKYLRVGEIPGEKVKYGYEMNLSRKVVRAKSPYRKGGWRVLKSDLDNFLGE